MKRTSYMRLFLGIVVISLGLGLLLDGIDVINFSHYFNDWWPMLVILGGLLSFMSNPRMWVWPLIIVGGGVILQLNALDAISFSVWSVLWPVVIILFGLSLIFKRSVLGEGKQQIAKDEFINLTAIFSGHNTRVDGQKLSGANLAAVFGGIELDLRDAKLTPNATIEVVVAFGGITLRIPQGYVIKVDAMPVMAGWEDKTDKPKNMANAPVLRISGTCLCGGLEIKN